MLKKRKLARGKFRVTFEVPSLPDVVRLSVVGDFNAWNAEANPMTQAADGSWSAALTLEGGRRYAFRYLADGQAWHDDDAPDGFSSNEYGGQNCVLDLESVQPSTPARKSAPRKARPKKA